MRIVVFAEGDTERVAGRHLKRFLDDRAGNAPKVRLHVLPFDHGLNENDVRTRAAHHLRDRETIGVVALTDLHPAFPTPEDARRIIRAWMPPNQRCHVHVAKHDFEAWLLAGWDAVLRHARIAHKKPWGRRPEDIDHDQPPAHRLRHLFAHEAKPPRRYSKVIDGRRLFEQLDLTHVARQCPEFRKFLNCLLSLAGYPMID